MIEHACTLRALLAEIVEAGDHQLAIQGIAARMVPAIQRCALALGANEVHESAAGFSQRPGPVSLNDLTLALLRHLFPRHGIANRALVAVGTELRPAIDAQLAQAWVQPEHCSDLTELRELLDGADEPPDLVIAHARGQESELLELLSWTAGDLQLHGVRVVPIGLPGRELRSLATALGAAVCFPDDAVSRPLFGSVLRTLLGFVDGTGLLELDDVRSGLPGSDRLVERIRTCIEDYATFRSDQWCAVAYAVRNLDEVPPGDRPRLLRAAVERVRSILPESCEMAMLGDDRFAVVAPDLDPAVVMRTFSAPRASLFESMEPGSPPRLVAAGVVGGIATPRDVRSVLSRSLAGANSATLDHLISLGQERRDCVLVIEGDEAQASFTSAILSRCGMTPIWRRDGVTGMAELRDNAATYSSVVLGLELPQLDGLQVLDRIRMDPLIPRVPVLMTTGSADQRYEYLALNRGASDFVRTPVGADVLMARLRRMWLENAHTAHTSREDAWALAGATPAPVSRH